MPQYSLTKISTRRWPEHDLKMIKRLDSVAPWARLPVSRLGMEFYTYFNGRPGNGLTYWGQVSMKRVLKSILGG